MEGDRVTVIGAGRLGLCWALCVEQAGYHVKAVDIWRCHDAMATLHHDME